MERRLFLETRNGTTYLAVYLFVYSPLWFLVLIDLASRFLAPLLRQGHEFNLTI
jgi:hypothetical protein